MGTLLNISTKPGAVIRSGVHESPGDPKARGRGGIAILKDGTIVAGRQTGSSKKEIQCRFGDGSAGSVVNFIGGGALLIEDGEKVPCKDLFKKQVFQQNKIGLPKQGCCVDGIDCGLRADQMYKTEHVLVGIFEGQAFLIGAKRKLGREIQDDLHEISITGGSGDKKVLRFGTVIKLDGGSGAYLRDQTGKAHFSKGIRNPTGIGINTRPR